MEISDYFGNGKWKPQQNVASFYGQNTEQSNTLLATGTEDKSHNMKQYTICKGQLNTRMRSANGETMRGSVLDYKISRDHHRTWHVSWRRREM